MVMLGFRLRSPCIVLSYGSRLGGKGKTIFICKSNKAAKLHRRCREVKSNAGPAVLRGAGVQECSPIKTFEQFELKTAEKLKTFSVIL